MYFQSKRIVLHELSVGGCKVCTQFLLSHYPGLGAFTKRCKGTLPCSNMLAVHIPVVHCTKGSPSSFVGVPSALCLHARGLRQLCKCGSKIRGETLSGLALVWKWSFHEDCFWSYGLVSLRDAVADGRYISALSCTVLLSNSKDPLIRAILSEQDANVGAHPKPTSWLWSLLALTEDLKGAVFAAVTMLQSPVVPFFFFFPWSFFTLCSSDEVTTLELFFPVCTFTLSLEPWTVSICFNQSWILRSHLLILDVLMWSKSS